MSEEKKDMSRRDFVKNSVRGAFLTTLGGLVGLLSSRSQADDTVWQIDPEKCIACTKCATHCVLEPSAVKNVNNFEMCGYCDICFGYFDLKTNKFNSGAENQLCPTNAIKRKFIEEPYYEYTIDESLCIGCGKCIKPCRVFGNASFFLQVRHDRCINCNDCSIASVCPSGAFERIPADKAYLLKGTENNHET